MELVEPIRSEKQVKGMANYLRGKSERDYVLFILGINSGLRISDLLKLTVDDVAERDRISIKEEKTGKTKDFPLSDLCKKVIKDYLRNQKPSHWLFPSRKSDKPISRIQAYRILNEASKHVGINEQIGTHSLRKTFGYWAYKQGVDVTRIQYLLNHSAPSITLRYIGITRDELDDIYINLNLGK
ncbi:site-specific integrase [Anaerospora sp.]|uniref:site-specific integrase n=1 Tax=Anaerospora sp. TaxID=1960278 RepID=UPI00289F8328|nr:site-specific integrase [Anaerospora sp.]